MLKRTLAVAAALCLVAGCGMEKTEDLGGMRSPTLSEQDNGFIRDITMGNLTEIQSSQMALQMSSSQPVKDFAQHMINDHTMANNTIDTLAKSKGAAVPKMLDSDHKNMVDGLKGKSGSDFDKAYVSLQIKAHQEAINVDQAEADNGNDGDLKSAANGLLPQLRMHLDEAQKLQSGMNGM
jgi:putative membrane protein